MSDMILGSVIPGTFAPTITDMFKPPDEKLKMMTAKATALELRVTELENAIREHRDSFPDEPLQGEYLLWKQVERSAL